MRPCDELATADRPVSAAFSRQLYLAVVGVVLLMAATLAGSSWMAWQQDRLAQAASRRTVAGGLETLVERSAASVLDYAVWSAAYENAIAGSTAWLTSNIGASTTTGMFDAALLLLPEGRRIGWEGGALRSDILDDATVSTLASLLADVPIDRGRAEVTYIRDGETLWLMAVARVVPQDGLPAGIVDAQLPRLAIGFRIDDRLLGGIGRRFAIDGLGVDVAPGPGRDSIALPGADGAPVGYVTWVPPTPGRAILRATLWPLVALMSAVGIIVLLAGRDLVRSASRLERTLDQARAADRSKTEFLSNVSHELRTPLNGVIGVAQLLQMRALDAEARHMLDILLASAHSQLQLVNGLLDISRVESGAMALARVPFDTAEVLEETVRLGTPDIEAKGLVLATDIAPDARRPMLGDPLAFRQIATNLIGNAVKFTERGRIAVDLRTGSDGTLILRVADTGIGIDPGQHQRIFDRFVQVDGASTRLVGGTGLGLAITRALVDLAGGTIEVASTLGAGATFTVTLPLDRADALTPAA